MGKKIRVYASEKIDGLEDRILSNSSIAYTSLAEFCDPIDLGKFKDAIKAVAGEGVGDAFSLYYLRSIMVSTGTNKNDDVFLPEELWKARHTPEDKPFNYEHNQDDVIGHITGNYCIDAQGSVIDDNIAVEDLPEEFHIVTSAVLYKEWKTKEKQDRMNLILEQIPKHERSVSMECILTGFDYMLVENNGTEKAIASIVPRKKETAYLTKHLRIYGGTGTYEGKQVKRVLRNITFSGKGLVTNPANPNSVILTDLEGATASTDSVYINSSEIKESLMATENLYETENKELKAKIEKMEAAQRERLEKDLKAQAEKFEVEAKVLRDENTVLKTELEKTAASLKEVSTAKAEVEVKLAKIEDDKKITDRTQAVATALNLDSEKAFKIVANLSKLADEEFNSWVKVQAEFEAEKVAAYKDAMSKGGTPATAGGDPMAKGGTKVSGSKPSEPTPLVVVNTPGASKKFAGEVVNLPKGTKPVNLPAGVTASEVVDPAEENTEVAKVEEAVPEVTPALAGSVVNEKVESRKNAISAYFGVKTVKESK